MGPLLSPHLQLSSKPAKKATVHHLGSWGKSQEQCAPSAVRDGSQETKSLLSQSRVQQTNHAASLHSEVAMPSRYYLNCASDFAGPISSQKHTSTYNNRDLNTHRPLKAEQRLYPCRSAIRLFGHCQSHRQ